MLFIDYSSAFNTIVPSKLIIKLAVEPMVSMATAPPTTARLSRGWCGLPNASPGANYQPSGTLSAHDVTEWPKRSSRTTTIQATACSPRYHPEGEVSTGASNLGLKD
jgi:hypothetical protein